MVQNNHSLSTLQNTIDAADAAGRLTDEMKALSEILKKKIILKMRFSVASHQARYEHINQFKVKEYYGRPVVKKQSSMIFKKNTKRHNYQVIQNTEDLSKQPGMEKSVEKHEYDDMAPIFRDPLDISKSLWQPKNIEHMWVPYDIPMDAAMRLKKNLNNIVKLSAKERAIYMDRLTEVRITTEKDTENNACDAALIGHKGLFTRRFVPAFTVVGVYSGAFLRNDIDFAALGEEFDPADMSDYLFRVAEDYKWPKISAFKLGNRLTIANAATNYEKGLEEGMNDVEHRRTIIPVYGKSTDCPFQEISSKSECPDVLFLVTCRDMAPQSQCLYDYGPIYWANNDK